MANVAILGTGQMGKAIARRLLDTGHRVTVWNRSAAGAVPLAQAGAEIASTPAEAAAGGGLIIAMLTDAAAVESVLLQTAMRPGALVVQMSTIGPDEVRGIAADLPPGVSLLDAPVGGSVGAAESGQLTIFAGGSDADVERAAPVLRDLGSIRRCGPIGSGAALKLVVNTALVTALASLHDALAIAESVGVDRNTALDTLAAGPLAGAVKRADASGASFAIALAAKDARLALAQRQAQAPVLAAALDLMETAPDQKADIASLTLIDLANP